MAVPVSILIPVKNEERNIARCLHSVSWAGEVWVVDSSSTDATCSIAEEMGAKVVQFSFNGVWPKKKNWALSNLPFAYPWVFILDADETLPPAAEEEIRSIVEDPHPVHSGYWINRRFQFMGKWLRHAYYPNWNLRLLRLGYGSYERMSHGPTESGDNEVHEHIVVQGSCGHLKTGMDHYAFPDVDTFIEKHNRYANWEAAVALESEADDSVEKIQDAGVRRRRRLKMLARKLPFRPWLRFFYVYFWQRGFLDGWEGYYFARLHGVYELLSIAKTHERRKKANSGKRV